MNAPYCFSIHAAGVVLVCVCMTAHADNALLPVVIVDSADVSRAGFAASPSATYYDQEELSRSGQYDLSRILRSMPSLSSTQGMIGGVGNFSLRGAEGGSGLVNIDGVPVFQTVPGLSTLSLFPVESFGGMDIRRGSASLMNYGRTLGGTINLLSRDQAKTGAGLRVEGGSYGTVRQAATVDAGNGDHQLNLTAGHADLFDGSYWADPSEGNLERDDFHARQFAMHLHDQLGKRLRMDSSTFYANSDSGVDKNGLMSRAPVPQFTVVDDPGRLKQELWVAQSRAKLDIHPLWQSELQLGYSEHRASADLGGILPGMPRNTLGFQSHLSLARWKNTHRIWLDAAQKRGYRFVWGGEGLYEQGRAVNGEFSRQRGTGSAFSNLQIDYGDWQATLAVRADHFDTYASHAVYHAGLSRRLNGQLSVFASHGTGYRLPSYVEMLMPFLGNLNLKPEQSVGGELGLIWQYSRKTQFSANYFQSSYADLIKTERTLAPLGLYPANNIPRARIQGMETQWRTNWSNQLSTGSDYTWTESRNQITGSPLPGQPQHNARIWGEWRWPQLPLKVWSQGTYRGKSFDTSGTTVVPETFQLDMQIDYQLAAPLNIYLRGDNLTDNRQSQRMHWSMPGAAFYGGFKWSL